MIAPRYVGASTTVESPASRNDFATSSSASMPPLVTSSSPSAGRRPCSASSRAASASRVPGSPCVGAYWKATGSPAAASSRSSSAARSAGKVDGSGKPPANEISSGSATRARIAAIPSPAPARVRAAKRPLQRRCSALTATAGSLLRLGLGAVVPDERCVGVPNGLVEELEDAALLAGAGSSSSSRRRRSSELLGRLSLTRRTGCQKLRYSRRRASASCAASCSAAFFEWPLPVPRRRPPTSAAQVKLRSCGGPSAERTT